MEKVEFNVKQIDIKYLIDAVISVKKERFDEDFIYANDFVVIKKLMEFELKAKGYDLVFCDLGIPDEHLKDSCFIYRMNDTEIMNEIASEDLRNIIYDKDLIFNTICQIMINKMNMTISKNCSTCDTMVCFRKGSEVDNNLCALWEHDHQSFLQDNLSCDERMVILNEFNNQIEKRRTRK